MPEMSWHWKDYTRPGDRIKGGTVETGFWEIDGSQIRAILKQKGAGIMTPDFDTFCREHSAQQIKTPQQQPKPTLGMTQNDCIDNAADYWCFYPDWQFCAGWFWDGENRLLAHAWNRKKKKHRDVTPFRGTPPTDYIVSEEWSQRLWQSVLQFRAGDQSQLGVIHPSYSWQDGVWIEHKVAKPEEQMADFFSHIFSKVKQEA